MILRRLAGLSRPFRGRVLAAVVASLAAAGFLALLAPVTGRVVGAALAGDRPAVVAGGGLAAAVVVGHLVALWLSERLFADVSADLGHVMRTGFTGRVAAAPVADVERHSPGDLLARGGTEIDEIAEFSAVELPTLVVSVGYLVVSVAVLVGHSITLTGVLLVVYLPAAAAIIAVFRRRSRDAFGEEAARVGTLAGIVAEGATVAGALREPAAATWWATRVAHANGRLREAIRATVDALNLFPLLLAVEAAAIAAILWTGVALAGDIATVSVFLVASGTLFATFGRLGDAFAALAAARAHARRHFEIIDELGPPQDGPRGGAALRDVRFAYPQRPPVLDGVSVEFPPGSRTAVAGPSGAGKSTLAKLLAGLYRPGAGTVEEGRSPVVLVAQESHLMAATVRANLLAPSVPDEEVLANADALGIGEWLAGRGGLDAAVVPHAWDAQDRQVLAILRAMLRRPGLLILDEPTASLDETLGDALLDRLDAVMADRTLVVIAHHASTIRRYPRLVTVEPGGGLTVTERGAPWPTSDAASPR